MTVVDVLGMKLKSDAVKNNLAISWLTMLNLP